jgi:hypothetical protein
MCTRLHVNYPLFLSSISESWTFSQRIFEKHSNIKFHENPSSGSRVKPCGRSDWQTDMTKVMVAFRNFANAPKRAYKSEFPYSRRKRLHSELYHHWWNWWLGRGRRVQANKPLIQGLIIWTLSEHLSPHFCILPTHNTQYFKLTGRRREVVTCSTGEQNKSVNKLHRIICRVLTVAVVQNDGRVSDT